MTEYPTVRIQISRRFWEDHTWSRQLPGGVLVRSMTRLVEVDVTRWEALEILSDARYYAETEDKDMLAEMGSFVRSAQSVVAKMNKIELPDGPSEKPVVEIETPIIDEDALALGARRKAVRAEHKMTDEADLGRYTITCGCGLQWTDRDTRSGVDAVWGEWHAHRLTKVSAA